MPCDRLPWYMVYNTFTDIDECDRGTDNCDKHAVCINLQGSYLCRCQYGYFGNGFTCKSEWTQNCSAVFIIPYLTELDEEEPSEEPSEEPDCTPGTPRSHSRSRSRSHSRSPRHRSRSTRSSKSRCPTLAGSGGDRRVLALAVLHTFIHCFCVCIR